MTTSTSTTSSFLLPKPSLKAKDLPQDLLPPKEILKAFKDAKQDFDFDSDATGHDRTWRWFYTQTNGNVRIANQEITQTISGVYRIKAGKDEWLVYGVSLSGINHKGEPVDFYHQEGKIESIPVFERKIDPDTLEVVTGPLIQNHKTLYTIPFTKAKFDEISKYFTDSVQFAIEGSGTSNKRLSCSLDEFRDLPFEELVKIKTSWIFTDYYRTKQLIQQA
jgi:hypothetical protein